MDKSLHNNNITAVILAGGRGERMGGQDKGLAQLWGQSLLGHVIDIIGDQVGGIIISANRNLDRYREFGVPVMADRMGEHWGPLAGVATALRVASTPYLLTVPCDAPCLPGDLVERMKMALELENADLCVAHDGERLQNTIALLPCSLVDELDAYLESGQRKVEGWLRQYKMAEVQFPDQAAMFLNVNSAEQLKRLQAQHGCR
ncbi:MAG: molybdenum cofactor guanylyltransferase MobA [Acidiferrobacterales bacterium]